MYAGVLTPICYTQANYKNYLRRSLFHSYGSMLWILFKGKYNSRAKSIQGNTVYNFHMLAFPHTMCEPETIITAYFYQCNNRHIYMLHYNVGLYHNSLFGSTISSLRVYISMQYQQFVTLSTANANWLYSTLITQSMLPVLKSQCGMSKKPLLLSPSKHSRLCAKSMGVKLKSPKNGGWPHVGNNSSIPSTNLNHRTWLLSLSSLPGQIPSYCNTVLAPRQKVTPVAGKMERWDGLKVSNKLGHKMTSSYLKPHM